MFKKLGSKKHSSVIALFNKEFVKTGLFDEKCKDILTKAFHIRIESDYQDFYIASKEEARDQIENAKYFLNEILNFIRKHYNISF
jgi:uncharacterized protein (UPF0332 family)